MSNAPGETAIPGKPYKVWSWYFRSPAELRCALEEYTAFEPGFAIPGGSGGSDPDQVDRMYRIYAQNRAIDRGMRDLLKTPKLWSLLHRYYRHAAWAEFKGWIGPAREFGLVVPRCPGPYRCRVGVDNRMDLPTCEAGHGCLSARDRFEASLSLAIEALFDALEARQNPKNFGH